MPEDFESVADPGHFDVHHVLKSPPVATNHYCDTIPEVLKLSARISTQQNPLYIEHEIQNEDEMNLGVTK